MDPNQNNEDQYQPTNPPPNDANNAADNSYKQEMQQIVNPVGSNQPNINQTSTGNSQPRNIKIANLLTNISLITWLLPFFGILVSGAAIALNVMVKKVADKRAQLRMILSAVGLVLSLACSGAVGYLIYDNSQSDSNASTVTPYPDETRSTYLETCMLDNEDEEFCNCMLSSLEQTYTIEEFNAIEQTFAETGDLSEDYLEFIDSSLQNCAPETTTEEQTTVE